MKTYNRKEEDKGLRKKKIGKEKGENDRETVCRRKEDEIHYACGPLPRAC
jgi:hypothetical protein